jgi:hypothetical protein
MTNLLLVALKLRSVILAEAVSNYIPAEIVTLSAVVGATHHPSCSSRPITTSSISIIAAFAAVAGQSTKLIQIHRNKFSYQSKVIFTIIKWK